MRASFSHEIENDPAEPEDAGTIRITATILDEYDNPTITTLSLAKDFIDDDDDECQSKQDLNYFLMEAGISDDDIFVALMNLIDYVSSVTCNTSSDYSPGCALKVRFDFIPGYLDDDDSQSQIEQVVQASFDETSHIRSRPASKLVVQTLIRKTYKKKIKKAKTKKKTNNKISLQECTICLQEFTNGGRVVTLPCGHDFDDECILKWFETSHVCPLCRFELPCEDQMNE